jgi:hypothetical protein
LDVALELSSQQKNDALRAAILYRIGHIRLDQRQFTLARSALDGALDLKSSLTSSLKGAIFQTSGLAYALTANDQKDKMKALNLLDQSGEITKENLQDDHFVRFNYGRYCLERADALIALKSPSAALRQLSEAEENLAPDQKRRMGYINILRAEAYMNLEKPKLDAATFSLWDAFNISTTIKSDYNIGYISRLHKSLAQSSFGNSIDVVELGVQLKNWSKNQPRVL